MFRRMETHPLEAPANTKVRLVDFCAVQSTLARSSIEAVARRSGWATSGDKVRFVAAGGPTVRTAQQGQRSALHTSAIAFVDQSSERREALETQFEHTLLHAIGIPPVTEEHDDTRRRLDLPCSSTPASTIASAPSGATLKKPTPEISKRLASPGSLAFRCSTSRRMGADRWSWLPRGRSPWLRWWSARSITRRLSDSTEGVDSWHAWHSCGKMLPCHQRPRSCCRAFFRYRLHDSF